MLPSALAAIEVSSPGSVGTASGASRVTVPRANSVSVYSRVGAYGEARGSAATMNLVVSAVAGHPATWRHATAGRVSHHVPGSADSTSSIDLRLLSLTVTTTWNGG